MTATEWNRTRAAALAAIAEHSNGEFPWNDEQQAYMDAVVEDILTRESAVQAAIDMHVKRILGLGIPYQRCTLRTSVECCNGELETLGYSRNPLGYPRIGFVALRRCPNHPTLMWSPLFDERSHGEA